MWLKVGRNSGFSNPKEERIKSGRASLLAWVPVSTFPPVFLAGGRMSRGLLVFLLFLGTSAAADIEGESWVTAHGGQHTSGPTVPSRGKAYLVKAVQAYASEVLCDLVRRTFPSSVFTTTLTQQGSCA